MSPDGPGSELNLSLICEATGLPYDYLTPETVRVRLMPGVAVAFTDGELRGTHSPDTDPVAIKHFGEIDFGDGTFGGRLRELLHGDDEALRYQADKLIRMAAYVFVQDVVDQKIALPSTPLVEIDTVNRAVNFDDHTVPLATPPQVVIDYGPGLQGRFHIKRQIIDHNEGRDPYTYLALTKGPFVNEFLMEYWMARSDRNFFRANVLGKLYLGREDGIASATNEFVDTQTKYMGSAAVADIVIASGVHTAGHEEIETAITNAHKLLKPDGTFLLRAPKSVDNEKSDVVSAHTMVETALAAGFAQDKAQFFDVVTGGEHLPLTQTLAAIFRK